MFLRLVSFSLVLAAATLSVRGAIERSVEKTFPISKGGCFKIDTRQGVIRVEASPDDKIHLLLREAMDIDNQLDADKRLEDLLLNIDAQEAQVSLQARFRKGLRWGWQSWPPVALTFEVKLPRGCLLDVKTAEGNVTVGPLESAVRISASNGTIFTGEVSGPLSIESTRGDVSVTACKGELNIRANSGNVLVGRAYGTTKIFGTSGLIEVQNALGHLQIDADGADVKVGFARSAKEAAELKAFGGDIEVVFDTRGAFTIDASSSRFGQVKTKALPLSIESGKAGSPRVIGTLNGGGPFIKIDSSGGNVRLVGRES
ncbi:MAG: DUF4097 family beta strand repeat-containing protein [Nibricoccus sp.]